MDMGYLSLELLSCQKDQQLTSIFIDDDKEKLLELVKEYWPTIDWLCESISQGARDCTRVLIQDLNLTPPHFKDDEILAQNVFSDACCSLFDPYVINLLIEESEYLPLVNNQSIGFLPIHETLNTLRLSPFLEKWSVGQSIFKLLILLCLPQTRSILETLKLLAQHTKGLEEIACYCAKDGGLMELTALLLVARHKVLVPMSGEYEDNIKYKNIDDEAVGVDISDMGKHRKCVRGLHVGLTISQHIIFDLGLPRHELEKSFDELSYEEIEMNLKDSLKMLQVFEKAGDAFDAYLQSDQSNVPVEQVIINIGLLLKKAGFNLEYKDVDLTNTCSEDVMKHVCKKLGMAGISFSEDVIKHVCKKLEITGSAQLEQEDEGSKEHKFTLAQISNPQTLLSGSGSSNQWMVKFRPNEFQVPRGLSFPACGLLKYRLASNSRWVSIKYYSSWRLTSTSRSFMTNTVPAPPILNVPAQRQLVGNSSMRMIAQVLTSLKKKGMWRV